MNAVTATCLDCGRDAPEVGYGGYLGCPSLSRRRPKVEGGYEAHLTFGFLYEPLEAMGLRPRDLEEMKQFLEVHDGHRIVAWTDAQPLESLPPALRKVLLRRSRRRTAALAARVIRRSQPGITGKESREWVFGNFGVSCRGCGVLHLAEEPDQLKSLAPRLVARAAVRKLLARWGKLDPDSGWNQGLRPLVDPYGSSMTDLIAFLKRHGRHRLEAAVFPVGGMWAGESASSLPGQGTLGLKRRES